MLRALPARNKFFVTTLVVVTILFGVFAVLT
jgi:hypothetical protein